MDYEPEMTEICEALGLPLPPREGPCWCNGPYEKETDHHSWCRESRKRWRKGIKRLVKLRDSNGA